MDYFQRPYILLFFLPLLGILLYSLHRKNFSIPLLAYWDRKEKEKSEHRIYFRNLARFLSGFLSYFAFSFLIFAAAGPGEIHQFIPDETQGVDLMIALDVSGSMVNSYDFLPNNRLTVSKKLLQAFVKRRENDRIGLVLFAGAAYLQSPLTSDRSALTELVEEAEDTSIEEQGTAIGDALIISSYRLKNSKARSKAIILLTDGVSNTGRLDPETASYAAKADGIKIYSIGIGKEMGQYEVNYESLERISEETGGKFYRAESPEDLGEVLQEIDNLETDPLPAKPVELVQTHFPEYLYWFFILLLLDGAIRLYPFKEVL
ncbi:VWA domain-containing protein BatA [Leptospira idonii]|uniref:VWA domain-containing protein n=1 Tax=Leptospira idonii TaxID=1193500 RepID=A0A4R9M4Q2_9LEPT|nr:VWA domain-containing protein [Leptospira idonii]TGN19718.1 VWA domain-containing protein [Leptospira idonii]